MLAGDALWASKWRGQPGRLEVWYTTLTDPRTGTGAWLHHEVVSPADGAAPFGHGWVAVFPAASEPLVVRTSPFAVRAHNGGNPLAVGDLRTGPGVHAGAAEGATWALTSHWSAPPLYPFPRWSWQREVLPGTQVVATPDARFDGTITIGDQNFSFADAPGASSRIYGHGNAHRWAWLHADLGAGAVLEIVAAVSRLGPLRKLAPLTFVRLRTSAGDLPHRAGLLHAARWRTRIGLPTWTVHGPLAPGHRLHVEVTLPEADTLALEYAEPHGHRVVCSNSERADVVVLRTCRSGRRWVEMDRWHLRGTAHAEVGGAREDAALDEQPTSAPPRNPSRRP